MNYIGEGLPVDATRSAANALDLARGLGHEPRTHRWRRLSDRMFGTTCQYCLRGLWVISVGNDWRAEGGALEGPCPGEQEE